MWARPAVAAAVMMTLVGCAGSAVGTAARPVASAAITSTTAQTGDANGLAAVASAYTLVAIDGHALPYARAYGSTPATSVTEVLSGTLIVDATGTFSVVTKYRASEAKGDQFFDGTFTGVCAPDGDGYRMLFEGGGENVLTAKGETVTVNNAGVLYQYQRQR